MTVGEKIKIARTFRGMTQKELGFLVGLSDDRIRHYELGDRMPKERLLQAFADSLGVPVSYFTCHNLETYVDVFQALFELEDNFSANIIKTDSGQYAITFEDHTMNACLADWYRRKKVYEHENENDIDDAKLNYSLWKARFPDSRKEH